MQSQETQSVFWILHELRDYDLEADGQEGGGCGRQQPAPSVSGHSENALAKDSLVPQMPTPRWLQSSKEGQGGLPITPLQQRTP